MEQQKIGQFLKELRKEKGLTQAQLAEVLGVTNRSVSRWENGVNMPDLDLLIQIADFYNIEIGEILYGERKHYSMEQTPTNDTLLKVADYTNHEKMIFSRRIGYFFAAGLAAMLLYLFMVLGGFAQSHAEIAGFLLGLVTGVLILGTIYTSKYMAKIRAFKLKLLQRTK